MSSGVWWNVRCENPIHVNFSTVQCEGELSWSCQCKVQVLSVKLIIWAKSVSGTPTRLCGCEISFNHSYLHGNEYWLLVKAEEWLHWKYPLFTALLSLVLSKTQDKNVNEAGEMKWDEVNNVKQRGYDLHRVTKILNPSHRLHVLYSIIIRVAIKVTKCILPIKGKQYTFMRSGTTI